MGRAVKIVKLVVSLLVAVAFVRGRPQEELRKQYTAHMKNVKDFNCAEPKLQAVPISDLFSDQLLSNEIISPLMTVLHRCGANSGCCIDKPNTECSPKTMEKVHLVFRTVMVNGTGNHGVKFKTIVANNHTSCSCQPKNEIHK